MNGLSVNVYGLFIYHCQAFYQYRVITSFLGVLCLFDFVVDALGKSAGPGKVLALISFLTLNCAV